jgi:hypothetical protein
VDGSNIRKEGRNLTQAATLRKNCIGNKKLAAFSSRSHVSTRARACIHVCIVM